MLDRYDAEWKHHIYLDGHGQDSHGLLKYEFIADRALFYAVKCYFLVKDRAEGDPPEIMRRMKGCSRVCQASLDSSHFELEKSSGLAKSSGYANRRKLSSTLGYQMVLATESKSLTHPINVKRRFDVRNSFNH